MFYKREKRRENRVEKWCLGHKIWSFSRINEGPIVIRLMKHSESKVKWVIKNKTKPNILSPGPLTLKFQEKKEKEKEHL